LKFRKNLAGVELRAMGFPGAADRVHPAQLQRIAAVRHQWCGRRQNAISDESWKKNQAGKRNFKPALLRQFRFAADTGRTPRSRAAHLRV